MRNKTPKRQAADDRRPASMPGEAWVMDFMADQIVQRAADQGPDHRRHLQQGQPCGRCRLHLQGRRCGRDLGTGRGEAKIVSPGLSVTPPWFLVMPCHDWQRPGRRPLSEDR